MNKKFKDIISKYKFSIILLPERKNFNSKTYSFNKIFISIIFYSIFLIIITALIIYFTPLNNLVYNNRENFSREEKIQLQDLNNRVILLMNELDKLKEINENLKKSILLGDSTLIRDLKSNNKGGIIKEKSQLQLGGNIFYIFKKLFFDQSENLITKLDSSKGINFDVSLEEEKIYFLKPISGSFISRKYLSDYGHLGIDFPAKEGTPIFATASGYVIFSDYTFDDGNMVIIAHNDNYISIYKHCSILLKKQSESVFQGEIIALSGNTGKLTTGPHLHFEIWKNGRTIDPQNYFIK